MDSKIRIFLIPSSIFLIASLIFISFLNIEFLRILLCNCATVSYKWYSYDVRYPLLTIIQNKSLQETKTIRTAYYSNIKTKDNNDNQNTVFSLAAENIKAKIYPNPFRSEFNIDYTITKDSDIQIEIYDNSGKKMSSVNKLNQEAGNYTETFNSIKLGSQLGMFHVRIIAGDEVISKTVVRGE